MGNKKLVCSRCEKDATELFECQRCTENVCDKCLAEYNQFTQIDYDCCKSCANSNLGIDDYDEQGAWDFLKLLLIRCYAVVLMPHNVIWLYAGGAK